MRIYSVHALGCGGIGIPSLVDRILSGVPLLIVLIAVALCAGCSMPLAVGKLTEVMVLASDDVWAEVESDIRGALEREIYSPRRETTFTVIHAEPGEPGEHSKWSKIVLIGSLEGDDLAGGLLPDEVRDEVAAEGGLIYTVSDVWARNQWVFILVTARAEEIPRYVKYSGDLLFSQVDRLLRGQVRERMFLSGHSAEREEELRKNYGFTLHLPDVYRLDESAESFQAVRFFNVNPQRSIFVYWEEAPRDSLDPETLLRKRMGVAGRFYPGDRLVEGRETWERVEFQGQRALKFMGQWENRAEIEGGTFTAYAFNCPESNRFFLLDAVLFAPNPRQAKYTYLIQMETIMESFDCARRESDLG